MNETKQFSLPPGLKTYLPSFAAIIVLLIIGEFIRKGFASIGNINTIIAQASILAVVASGQLFVIISGNSNIDLSVGACMSMGAMFLPLISRGDERRIPLAILCIALLSVSIGLVSGIGVHFLKIPALAMTLVMATVVDGLTLAVTRGNAATTVPGFLKKIGKPVIFNLRMVTLIVLVMMLVIGFLLQATRTGKSIYLIGSNRYAARLSGLPTARLEILAFVMASLTSALGGVLLAGYVGNGQLKMGDSYTMMSIASCVIGGANMAGGYGKLLGAVFGSIVLTLLTSLLVVFGLNAGTRTFLQGVILSVILIVNARSTAKLRQ